jgi:beta-lactamase class A
MIGCVRAAIAPALGGIVWIALAGAPVMAREVRSPAANTASLPVTIATDIADIARSAMGSRGIMGVAAWRLDGRGPTILYNADEAFPMASTFKVAVAGKLMQRIEAGQLSLGKMITIDPDREIDSPTIAERLIHPGIMLSVHNLLELMLTDSDNTATDYLLDEAGGPAAVTDWVRAQGVDGLRIDGGTDEIIRRYLRMGRGPFPRVLKEMIARDPELLARADKPDHAFDTDPRDTASPRAMAKLLTRIFVGKALNPEDTRLLIEIMERDRTGPNRLRGLMPPGTEVADKTGTIGGTINDVGVITLAGDAKIVVVVFIKASDASIPVREKAIAQIGRAVRDYYAYATP